MSSLDGPLKYGHPLYPPTTDSTDNLWNWEKGLHWKKCITVANFDKNLDLKYRSVKPLVLSHLLKWAFKFRHLSRISVKSSVYNKPLLAVFCVSLDNGCGSSHLFILPFIDPPIYLSTHLVFKMQVPCCKFFVWAPMIAMGPPINLSFHLTKWTFSHSRAKVKSPVCKCKMQAPVSSLYEPQ